MGRYSCFKRCVLLLLKDFEAHLPLQKSPSPQNIHNENCEKAEDKTAAKDNAMICPGIICIQIRYLANNRPRKDVKKIR